MRKRFRLFKNQKGMTLIELLAVVTVLGIISAIAVPAIAGTISTQKTNADTSSLKVINEAALRYLYDNYPDGSVSGAPTSLGINTKLIANGYLSAGADKLQVTSGGSQQYYTSVAVSYDSAKGWTVGSATISGSQG